jgi:transcription antitermination factor NusG
MEGRFKVGQHVMIRQDDPSPFAGLSGVIEAIQPHDRGITVLDRYIVAFTWGEKQAFYDAQLEPG